MSSLQNQTTSTIAVRSGNQTVYRLEPTRNSGIDPVEMFAGEHFVGSGTDLEIPLNIPGVAERHCRIVCEHGILHVHALDPRTWVNDGPIRQARLRPGDRLAIGPVNFLFQVSKQNESQPVPSQLNTPRHHSAEEEILNELQQSLAQTRQELDELRNKDRSEPTFTPPPKNTETEKRFEQLAERERHLRRKADQVSRLHQKLARRRGRLTADHEEQQRMFFAERRKIEAQAEQLQQRSLLDRSQRG